MNHAISSFLSGWVYQPARMFFAKQVDELVDDDQPNSSFFVFDNDLWSKYSTNVGWPAIAMTVAKPKGGRASVVAVSPHGDYWEVEPSTLAERTGQIGQAVTLRNLATIGDVTWACGMDRRVLRRDGPGNWADVGPADRDGEGVVGFEGIDGFAPGDIYCAGWQGEIWWLKSKRWQRIDSPVSANLNSVHCAGDGLVYIVGDDGVLLRGRENRWAVVETDREENLMDVRLHDGTLYVSTDFEILKLGKDGLEAETEFDDEEDQPATCLKLLSAEGVLVSMGPKDLFRRTTGAWARLV